MMDKHGSQTPNNDEPRGAMLSILVTDDTYSFMIPIHKNKQIKMLKWGRNVCEHNMSHVQ